MRAMQSESTATAPGTTERIDDAVMWRLLGYSLAQATIPLSKQFRKSVGSLGLTQVEFTVLMLVAHNVELVQSQLCTAIGVSPPNMTNVLARLFARDLLARSRSQREIGRAHV